MTWTAVPGSPVWFTFLVKYSRNFYFLDASLFHFWSARPDIAKACKKSMMWYHFLSWPKPINGKTVPLGLLSLTSSSRICILKTCHCLNFFTTFDFAYFKFHIIKRWYLYLSVLPNHISPVIPLKLWLHSLWKLVLQNW